jgi:hypothetical protein
MSFYMSPQEGWYLTVARITASFSDGGAQSTGTGFFVSSGSKTFLVTARHVVDAWHRPLGKQRRTICTEIKFHCSNFGSGSGRNPSTLMLNSKIAEPNIKVDAEENDLAVILVSPEEVPLPHSADRAIPKAFPTEMIADETELNRRDAGEQACFIGFPENSPIIEYSEFRQFSESLGYDVAATFPLYRQAALAMPVAISVSVQGFSGSNYGVLDGYSNSGFSGSPVITLQRGFPPGNGLTQDQEFAPARVIGVVCGHYLSAGDRANGMHSGMSYFVRSTSIRKLLEPIVPVTTERGLGG